MRDFFPGYVIDTCALIDLWRRHYAKDVFPNVWKRLDELIHDGKLAAPHEVLDELQSCDDELLGWAQKQKFFVKIDAEQIELAREIIKDFPSLISKEKTIADADPFVIALARAKEWAVVTSEKSAGAKIRKKIPDVCGHYRIECISVLDMFRKQQWTF